MTDQPTQVVQPIKAASLTADLTKQLPILKDQPTSGALDVIVRLVAQFLINPGSESIPVEQAMAMLPLFGYDLEAVKVSGGHVLQATRYAMEDLASEASTVTGRTITPKNLTIEQASAEETQEQRDLRQAATNLSGLIADLLQKMPGFAGRYRARNDEEPVVEAPEEDLGWRERITQTLAKRGIVEVVTEEAPTPVNAPPTPIDADYLTAAVLDPTDDVVKTIQDRLNALSFWLNHYTGQDPESAELMALAAMENMGIGEVTLVTTIETAESLIDVQRRQSAAIDKYNAQYVKGFQAKAAAIRETQQMVFDLWSYFFGEEEIQRMLQTGA